MFEGKRKCNRTKQGENAKKWTSGDKMRKKPYLESGREISLLEWAESEGNHSKPKRVKSLR